MSDDKEAVEQVPEVVGFVADALQVPLDFIQKSRGINKEAERAGRGNHEAG